MMAIILIIPFIVFAIFICNELRKAEEFENSPLELQSATINDGWVNDSIYQCAEATAMVNFRFFGNKIYSSDGKFTSTFSKEIAKEVSNILNKISNGNSFSKEFCSFVSNHHSDAKHKDFYDVMSDYLQFRYYNDTPNFDLVYGNI